MALDLFIEYLKYLSDFNDTCIKQSCDLSKMYLFWWLVYIF